MFIKDSNSCLHLRTLNRYKSVCNGDQMATEKWAKIVNLLRQTTLRRQLFFMYTRP